MSGLGLKIRTPQMTNRQKQSEREQMDLGKEIVAYNENEHLNYDPLDKLLLLAARHKQAMESRSDPSEFIGLTAPNVSPHNPFIRFGNSTVHNVSPLSYHTLTPNNVNQENHSPVPTIKFGTKRRKRSSAKLRTKLLPKYLRRKSLKKRRLLQKLN